MLNVSKSGHCKVKMYVSAKEKESWITVLCFTLEFYEALDVTVPALPVSQNRCSKKSKWNIMLSLQNWLVFGTKKYLFENCLSQYIRLKNCSYVSKGVCMFICLLPTTFSQHRKSQGQSFKGNIIILMKKDLNFDFEKLSNPFTTFFSQTRRTLSITPR